MFKATKEIAAYLEEKGIKYDVNGNEKLSFVKVRYKCDNLAGIEVVFLSSDDDNDVSVRVMRLVKVPENKRTAVLKVINDLHCRFRYVNFVLDKDGDVRMDYDMPLRTSNVGAVAKEICSRMVNIGDKVYPELMKAIWS